MKYDGLLLTFVALSTTIFLANFALPGDRVFANPGAIPKLFTRTRFFSEFNYRFDACISSLLVKPEPEPELHGEIGSYRRESKFFS